MEGVSNSLVLAISKGARMMLAIPAAETATAKDASGKGEDKTSNPPA